MRDKPASECLPASTRADALRAYPLARSEALRLLALALGVTREHILAHPDTSIEPAQRMRYDELAQQRLRGVPLAYLTGTQEFFGLDFAVSPAVLIPRPDTECLVEEALRLSAPDSALDVLELGTGSGCIAIALARERPRWRIQASDRSTEALEVARRNGARHHVEVELRQSDWFQSITGTYDLIVSNPPYIAAEDPHLADLGDEPRGALTDESDGLQALTVIATSARRHLRRGGLLLLEHGYDQGPQMRRLLQGLGYSDVRTCQDAASRDRVAVAHWSACG